MEDAEFSFQQCLFLLKFNILQFFFLLKHLFILGSSFLQKNSSIYTGFK